MLHHVTVEVPCDFGELIAPPPASVAAIESHSDRRCRNASAFAERRSMGLKVSRRSR